MSDEGTVTTWVGELRRGNMEAARRLWERYFGELLRVARARLPRHFRRASDEEDVAISAFDSFIQGVARGRCRTSATVRISGECSSSSRRARCATR